MDDGELRAEHASGFFGLPLLVLHYGIHRNAGVSSRVLPSS